MTEECGKLMWINCGKVEKNEAFEKNFLKCVLVWSVVNTFSTKGLGNKTFPRKECFRFPAGFPQIHIPYYYYYYYYCVIK